MVVQAPERDEAAETMRVVIVGGVAGGMSAATRLRRLDEHASITVVERSGHVSYANCGLPYFVGGVIEDEDDLLLQTAGRLFDRFRLDVRVNAEVVDIDPARHSVAVRSTVDGSMTALPYDKLVLSPGAEPLRPPIPGSGRVRVLRTVEDAERLATDVTGKPATAVVIGGGFVGLETAENLAGTGITVTVVEAARQILTPLDPELAIAVAAELMAHGVTVQTGVAVAEVTSNGVILADRRVIPGELVVASIGVRPDVRLAQMAGLTIGPRGGITVDGSGLTNDPDIYAVGDAVEKSDRVGGGSSLIALANLANRQGRRVADHIAGLPSSAGALSGNRHRQDLWHHGVHDRVERDPAPCRRSQVPHRALAPNEPRRLLPRCRADVPEDALRSGQRRDPRRTGRRGKRRRQAY